MTIELNLNSIDDIQRLKTKIVSLKMQLPQFQAITIRKLANEILIDEIQKRMESAGISKKIIASTYLDNIEIVGINTVRIFVKSEYFADTGFDVALAVHEGTRGHMIRPKEKKALSWIQGGVRRFSKGHWVSGIRSLRIVYKVLRENKILLQTRYNQEQEMWIKNNLTGGGF